MTDESTPTAEPAAAPTPAPASELHSLADDLHALLSRVEGLEHEIKAELASDLEAIVAKLKAARVGVIASRRAMSARRFRGKHIV